MKRFLPTALVLLSLCSVALVARNEVQSRTVHVSAVDKQGIPVTDLRPDEIVLREDGKAQPAIKLERANQPVRLALVVHNRGQGNAEFREGLTAFVDAMNGRGDMAIFSTTHPQTTLVNFTADQAAWRSAIDVLVPQQAPTPENAALFHPGLSAGAIVREVVHQFDSASTPRPVIVVVWVPVNTRGMSLECGAFPCSAPRTESDPTSKQYIGAGARNPVADFGPDFGPAVVDQLRSSRATFYAVSTRDGAGVFSDAARVTGGRVETVLTDAAILDATKAIAADIGAQYAITYNATTAKDGAKLRVESTRPGVTIRAPERVR